MIEMTGQTDTHSAHLLCMRSLVLLLLQGEDLFWIAMQQQGFLVEIEAVVVRLVVRLQLLINICPRVIDT